MFRRAMPFALAGLLSGTAWAAPESYAIDPRHTFPSFEINHMGFSTQRGRFNRTAGHIMLDRQAQKAAAEITIDASSLDTGLIELEERLRKPDFFDVANYPTITLKSTGARFDGETLTALDGHLTIRGQTKPVTLAISKLRCGAHPTNKKAVCGADATAAIRRSDFGMTYGLPVLGDEVKLLIQIEAVKD